jgi:hypothetical protein
MNWRICPLFHLLALPVSHVAILAMDVPMGFQPVVIHWGQIAGIQGDFALREASTFSNSDHVVTFFDR